MIKIRNLLINITLITLIMSLFMFFLILCEKYNETHYAAAKAYQEMKAAEYKAKAEQHKMETAKLRLEVEEVRLQAFLNTYGAKKK